MTVAQIIEIVDRIEFHDWFFTIGDAGERNPYLQVNFMARDAVSGLPTLESGRKWRLSPHMTETEIVSTAFIAIRQALEHEAREFFLYKGARVFGPHFDVNKLVELAGQADALDTRKDPTDAVL